MHHRGLLLTVLSAAMSMAAGAFAQSAPGAPATRPFETPIHIVMVGDSTMCEYAEAKPDRGWGHFVADHFQPGTVKVTNLAAAGRSTKTYISEGRWQKALDQKPNVIIIQFGHNDSHAAANHEATNAQTDYKDNLRRYIDEARAIGATPILVTPMVRRNFDKDGKIKEGTVADPDRTLGVYAEAMKAVAAEKKVAVIDLHASSLALAEKLGQAASNELANKAGDNTHFNEKGARTMADLVFKDFPTAVPELAKYLKQ